VALLALWMATCIAFLGHHHITPKSRDYRHIVFVERLFLVVRIKIAHIGDEISGVQFLNLADPLHQWEHDPDVGYIPLVQG
jgi:hypothetical protein